MAIKSAGNITIYIISIFLTFFTYVHIKNAKSWYIQYAVIEISICHQFNPYFHYISISVACILGRRERSHSLNTIFVFRPERENEEM